MKTKKRIKRLEQKVKLLTKIANLDFLLSQVPEEEQEETNKVWDLSGFPSTGNPIPHSPTTTSAEVPTTPTTGGKK